MNLRLASAFLEIFFACAGVLFQPSVLSAAGAVLESPRSNATTIEITPALSFTAEPDSFDAFKTALTGGQISLPADFPKIDQASLDIDSLDAQKKLLPFVAAYERSVRLGTDFIDEARANIGAINQKAAQLESAVAGCRPDDPQLPVYAVQLLQLQKDYSISLDHPKAVADAFSQAHLKLVKSRSIARQKPHDDDGFVAAALTRWLKIGADKLSTVPKPEPLKVNIVSSFKPMPIGLTRPPKPRPAVSEKSDSASAGKPPSDEGFEEWIRLTRERAFQWIADNASFPGAAPGVIVASPQSENPDYRFDWIRDSALTMKVISNLYRQVLSEIANAKDSDEKWRYTAEGRRLRKLLLNYANRQEKIQNLSTLGGLGEPKVNRDGSSYDQSWGRPQNDGPALRAIALIHFAETLLSQGRKDLVRKRFYAAELPAGTIIKKDLEYVAHHWRDPSFDAWEEVLGHHFFTRMVQRRALVNGARLASAMGDLGAARSYLIQAREIEREIEKHWRSELGLIIPTLDSNGNPGQDGGLDFKFSRIDSIVVTAIMRGTIDDEEAPWPPELGEEFLKKFRPTPSFFSPTDDRVLATVAKQQEAFRKLYPINQRPEIPGVAIGRYPEDRFDGTPYFQGGNPWVVATNSFGEFYHFAAKRFTMKGEIIISELNLPFFRLLNLPEADRLQPGMMIPKSDPLFTEIIQSMREAADGFIRRIYYHVDRTDGSWAEQIDRYSGYKRSAEKLTWNSAAFIRESDNRREAQGETLTPHLTHR